MAEQDFDATLLESDTGEALRFVCWRLPLSLCTLGRMARALSPPLKITEKLCERHGIKHPARRHAALAGHFDTPVHVVELPNGVGVGINAEYAAVIQSLLMPAPVEIEPPRMGIDFNRNAVLSAGSQNPVDVDLISRAALELSAGHVAENGRIGILDRRAKRGKVSRPE